MSSTLLDRQMTTARPAFPGAGRLNVKDDGLRRIVARSTERVDKMQFASEDSRSAVERTPGVRSLAACVFRGGTLASKGWR